MFSKPMRDMMKPSHAALLEALKRSDGLSVADLARELKMSYMGVKQHCVKLAGKGYLQEWRVPRAEKEVGRPQKLYFLTEKCAPLFPQGGGRITLALLEGMKSVYGESAPEKMLYHFFQELETRWLAKMARAETLPERAAALTKLRDKEGWFSRLCESDGELRIEEFHNPLRRIYREYPGAERLEEMMLGRLLGEKTRHREVETAKGRKRVQYEIG